MKKILINIRLYVVCFLVCFIVIEATVTICNNLYIKDVKASAQIEASSVINELQNNLSHYLYISEFMKTWIALEDDETKKAIAENPSKFMEDFKSMYASFYKDHSMCVFEMISEDIIQFIYLSDENQIRIASRVFEKEEQRNEYILSMETGETIVSGFADYVIPQKNIISITPVYFNNGDFWGFATIVLQIPEIFQTMNLDSWIGLNYDYELFYFDEQSEKVVVDSQLKKKSSDSVGETVSMYGREWVLNLEPINGWIPSYVILLEKLMTFFLSIIFSILVSKLIIARKNELRIEKEQAMTHEALKQAYEAANKANVAKTNFLANMSHDMRTPMNAIIGMTALASANIEDKESVSDCLNKISISSQHLLELINDVLDMSKMESGKMGLNEERFNIIDVIQSVVDMSKIQIEKKKHTFSFNYQKVAHENVIGDSQKVKQACMNLLSNAIKYTPDGGYIKLCLKEVETNKDTVGCFEIIVEDNGIGMSEEYIKNLFTPFERADDSRVYDIVGTGLGMPITRNIVQMMNGEIQVESKLNEGTKFIATIYLAIDKPEQKMEEPPALKEQAVFEIEQQCDVQSIKDMQKKEKKPKENHLKIYSDKDFSSKHILIVEDNIFNAQVLGDILAMTGAHIDYAKDGSEAVDIMMNTEENYYDIILMDIKMPKMDGYAATKAIRTLEGTYFKKVPIIAMTANAFADDVVTAKKVGMNEHIAKPLNFTKVMEVLDKYLENE